MNTSAKKRSGASLIIALIALILVLASLVMLCSRIFVISDSKKAATNINLITANSGSKVSSSSDENPGIEVSDDTQVWSQNTSIDIFKSVYENGEKKVTVAGSDGDLVLAPGTTNDYSFKVSNTGSSPISYNMTVEAYVTVSSDIQIPVEVKFYDYTGKYFTGTESAWADALELNGVQDSAVLAKEHYALYTLEWQWPFESGADDYDTYLGNEAVNEDITFTIVITTEAEAYTGPDSGGGIPQTGGYVDILLWAVPAAVSLAVIIAVPVYLKKRKTDDA